MEIIIQDSLDKNTLCYSKFHGAQWHLGPQQLLGLERKAILTNCHVWPDWLHCGNAVTSTKSQDLTVAYFQEVCVALLLSTPPACTCRSSQPCVPAIDAGLLWDWEPHQWDLNVINFVRRTHVLTVRGPGCHAHCLCLGKHYWRNTHHLQCPCCWLGVQVSQRHGPCLYPCHNNPVHRPNPGCSEVYPTDWLSGVFCHRPGLLIEDNQSAAANAANLGKTDNGYAIGDLVLVHI